MWKIYQSWEKQSLESGWSDGSFSRIRRATAAVLPVTALNSDSTVVPRETTAYKIAIAADQTSTSDHDPPPPLSLSLSLSRSSDNGGRRRKRRVQLSRERGHAEFYR
uniref:Uncharacterized protein n=1 Tax=Opuntia streptacantha TaxID=393608 RepID=A0A7C8YK76_OPUST